MNKKSGKFFLQTFFLIILHEMRFNFQLEGRGIRSKPGRGGLGLAWICAMIFRQTMPGSLDDNKAMLYLVTHLSVPDPLASPSTTMRKSSPTSR